MWFNKKACADAHGIDGLNKITEMLRPYTELRGFFFGARSVILRECVPAEISSSTYTQLREITLDKNGEILALDFNPIKKNNFGKIAYVANKRSKALAPLATPVANGDAILDGFFSKQSYCIPLTIFRDVISVIGKGVSEIQTMNLKCEKTGSEARLIRNVEKLGDGIKHGYIIYCKDAAGKEIRSESISFEIKNAVLA